MIQMEAMSCQLLIEMCFLFQLPVTNKDNFFWEVDTVPVTVENCSTLKKIKVYVYYTGLTR